MTDVKVLAEWLRRRDCSVLKSDSSYWAGSGLGTYQAIPYHALITPPEMESKQFLWEHKATAIRYSTPLEAPSGSLSYHVVYERGEYSQKDLPKKARHDVKKGLSMAVIEPISFSRLSAEGWHLRHATLLRQGRPAAETEGWWQRLCLSAQGLEGFEAWGACVDGKLAAALLGFLCDDCYCILFQQSLTEYLHFGINNALTYVVTSETLPRPEVRQIFYGLHSLDAPASVDEYKFRMGYQAKPVRQRIQLFPSLRPLVNPFTHSLLKWGCRVFPENHIFSKAEGVFRFYLNGKLPAALQTPPEGLSAASRADSLAPG